MQKRITLGEHEIVYTLKKNKKSKGIRLIIHTDGSFIVTAPRRMPEAFVTQFIRAKSEWVIEKLDYFKHHPNIAFQKGTKKEYEAYKDNALALVEQRIKYFNTLYGFQISGISIKNQKTRWGSCSRKGNLNFNYKIVLLPEKFSDYIIVHELCHLKEFNHSQKFWDLVARAVPDYKHIRKELKALTKSSLL